MSYHLGLDTKVCKLRAKLEALERSQKVAEEDSQSTTLQGISDDIASLATKLGIFTNICTQVCSTFGSVEYFITCYQLEDTCIHLKTLLLDETTSAKVGVFFLVTCVSVLTFSIDTPK